MDSIDSEMRGDNMAASMNLELQLRRKIEQFYLPRQLVEAIVDAGGIHTKSNQTSVGIGFLDISGYTFLSNFLSPAENQMVLNGLYSAFNWVLKKHGGYLNKIEGDSLMFHYGGPIDPAVLGMDSATAERHIARELFYTCVELQRVTNLFNQNNENFLRKISDRVIVDAILQAYAILGQLRSGYLSTSFNALFQIRIRVGASMGEVLIGNFGPDGAKQWDVIGMPVIDARRMETSAPIGGLRITENFFHILHESGITIDYHSRIQREAQLMGGVYKDITFNELFRKSFVYLKDKKNASFTTYSIQVNPALPESIKEQSKLLLLRDEKGAEVIVDFIRYYRGNHFVIDQIENLFAESNVNIRKESLYRIMFPRKYRAMLKEHNNDVGRMREMIFQQKSLRTLLVLLGKIQDAVKSGRFTEAKDETEFGGYDYWMKGQHASVKRNYNENKVITHRAYYFYNVVFPLFFAEIKAAILEYQAHLNEPDDLEEACEGQ